jgi:hypothetical protein
MRGSPDSRLAYLDPSSQSTALFINGIEHLEVASHGRVRSSATDDVGSRCSEGPVLLQTRLR